MLSAAPVPRLHCLVAEVRGEVVGYATCALEMSTWAGREYLHMDCLFLRDGYRGAGLGAQLVDAVLAVARHFGVAAAEWQTPPWNAGAVRFYERLGGRARPKVRFTLTTSDATPPVRDE